MKTQYTLKYTTIAYYYDLYAGPCTKFDEPITPDEVKAALSELAQDNIGVHENSRELYSGGDKNAALEAFDGAEVFARLYGRSDNELIVAWVVVEEVEVDEEGEEVTLVDIICERYPTFTLNGRRIKARAHELANKGPQYE